jgi:biopolymer transport protein ExbD
MSRGRWAVHDEADQAAEGELNLIPYLDIMVNLVIFLLFTFQVVIEVCRIDLVTPAYGTKGPGEVQPEEQKLATLTVAIHKAGYTVLSDNPEMGVVDIPLKGRDYDTRKLADKLHEWKTNFKVSPGLAMMGDDDTEYSIVILTMDAIRTYQGKDLFPDIMLAKPAGTVVKP